MDLAIDTGFITRAPSSKTNPKGITFVGEDWGTVTFRDSNLDVSDLLGYEVKVVWNADKQNDADAIYGIYKTADNSSVETTWADVAKDGTTAKVKFGNTTYTLDLDDNRLPQDTNNANIVAFADGEVNYLNADAFNEDALADKVIFIDNDADGDFEAVQIKTQDATQITYVGTSNIDTKDLLATGRIGANQYDPFDNYENTPKLADVNTYEGIAKDDYAKVSYDYYNDKVTYEKIDAVSATIEATRTTGAGTKEIRIDGTWYKPAEGYNMPSVVSGDTIEYIAIGTLLYNVKKTDGTWGSKSLAVVYDVARYGVGSKANELEVSFITRDGVKKTALLDKYNNVEVTYTYVDGGTSDEWDVGGDKTLAAVKTELEGKLLTYRESGNEVSLMPVSKAQAAGYDDIYDATGTDNHVTGFDNANGKLTINGGGSVSIADTAVAFVWEDGDADVLTGKSAKSAFKNAAPAGVGQVAAGGEENGVNYIQACTIQVADVDAVNVVGSNYAYVISAGETNKTDDYREFYLWTVNGEMVAYEKTSDFYEFQGGEIISYDVTSTGDMTVIDNVEVVLGNVGRVTSTGLYGSNNSKVAIGGTEFDLDAACEIVNVDTNAKEGIEGDAASAVRYGQAGKFNILYVTNGDGDIVFILVDGVNDEIKTTTTIDVSASANIANDVTEAFKSFNYVAMDDNTTINAALTIPTGKRLTINGNLTNANNLTVNGELVVTGTIDDASALTGTGYVTVAGIKDTVANTKADFVITGVEVAANAYTGGTLGDDSTITLTFNKNVDASSVANTDFTFSNSTTTVSNVEVSGKTITLTIATSLVGSGETLSMTGNIKDYAGLTIDASGDVVTFVATYNGNHGIA